MRVSPCVALCVVGRGKYVCDGHAGDLVEEDLALHLPSGFRVVEQLLRRQHEEPPLPAAHAPSGAVKFNWKVRNSREAQWAPIRAVPALLDSVAKVENVVRLHGTHGTHGTRIGDRQSRGVAAAVVEPYALLEKMAQVQPIHDLACLSRLAVHLQLSLGSDVLFLMMITMVLIIQETIITKISFAASFH